jgi:hypothetical protein
MPKVLRNYYFENNQVKILDIKGIFPDMPLALCDLGREYKNPVVVQQPDKPYKEIYEQDDLEVMAKKAREQKAREEEKQAKKEKQEKKGGEE